MVKARDPSEGWYVHLSMGADEGGYLLEAARGIVAERGASLVVSPDSDLKELVLFSREDEEERARDAVIDVHQRLRRVAGLDAQPARVVALARPSEKGKSRSPKHRLDVTLMQEANRVLSSESYHEWAVVLAPDGLRGLRTRHTRSSSRPVGPGDCRPGGAASEWQPR
jgi:hypothetical protein